MRWVGSYASRASTPTPSPPPQRLTSVTDEESARRGVKSHSEGGAKDGTCGSAVRPPGGGATRACERIDKACSQRAHAIIARVCMAELRVGEHGGEQRGRRVWEQVGKGTCKRPTPRHAALAPATNTTPPALMARPLGALNAAALAAPST